MKLSTPIFEKNEPSGRAKRRKPVEPVLAFLLATSFPAILPLPLLHPNLEKIELLCDGPTSNLAKDPGISDICPDCTTWLHEKAPPDPT